MKNEVTNQSLKRKLRQLSVKWTLVGLALSLVAGFGGLLYSSKIASEKEVQVLGESMARAFRSEILNGNIRDTQFQMNAVIGDEGARSVRILDRNQNEIYPIPTPFG